MPLYIDAREQPLMISGYVHFKTEELQGMQR